MGPNLIKFTDSYKYNALLILNKYYFFFKRNNQLYKNIYMTTD